jgi:VWFA-related protein
MCLGYMFNRFSSMFGLVLLAASPVIFAQNPSAEQTTTIHVTSRLIVLDVVVTDSKGHVVTGLDKSQFTVTEDKVPQTIKNFDPPSTHTMPAGADHAVVNGTADLPKIGNAPVNILVIDQLNSQFEHAAYARQQMEAYLKRQPEILPVPTQLIAAGNIKFIVLHEYTQNRAELIDALKKQPPEFPKQLMSNGNVGTTLLSQTLGVLSQIAEASRGTPGRKNVIWVGTGYPSVNPTSLNPSDEEKLTDVIRRVTDRMLASRVTLYVVDPAGLQFVPNIDGPAQSDVMDSPNLPGLSPFDGKYEFDTFAPATGGRVFAGRNDVDAEIAQGIAESNSYYTLTYVPTNATDDPKVYRKIRVRTKDPNLHVTTRSGYFAAGETVDAAPPDAKKPSTQLKFDIASAAKTTLVYNGLKVDARKAKNGYLLAVEAIGLQWNEQPDGSKTAEVTVMAVFYNAKDKELGQHAAELKEELGKDDKIVPGAQVGFSFPVTLPFGTDRVRFVVRDAATGTLGSADAKP